MKAAGLQVSRIEMGLPLGAGLAERVLELDGLVAHRPERLQRPGNVLGQLRPHAPQLRADRNLLPSCSRGASHGREQHRGGGSTTELQGVTTGRLSITHERVPPLADAMPFA